MKLIYKILVGVVCMHISTQLFCMKKSAAQRYVESCDKIDNTCEKRLKELCVYSRKIDCGTRIKDVILKSNKLKKKLTDRQFGQFSRIEKIYNISDDDWGLCLDLAKARERASCLSSEESCLTWPKRKKRCRFICESKIDSAFVEILQCAFLRESFDPAKFRLRTKKNVSYVVKPVQITRVTDDQGCIHYQETDYGLIIVNPLLIDRLSPLLQEAFSLFLISCVEHHNRDYLSDIQAMNNITIKDKDAFCSSIHQTSLLLVALQNQETSMLLKELFRNRNMFFDTCDDAARYYKKMCEINTFHKYVGWLNECSDKSSEKQKVVQYKQVEKK